MPEDYRNDADNTDESGVARSFWSGTIAFGLVSLPVSLFTATRPGRVSLRMLDEDGTPLQRRFFCSREDKELSRDELVRGFEIEKDKYIEVQDEELEALAPEKSREIDLRRFVPLADIDPMYFERAYFLVPEEGASKAYRLLAKSMESMGRAGIATFVMRGKEYLIAIIAEGGILRAETLRFHDELRTPADIGLPPLDKVADKDVKNLLSTIGRLAADDLERNELTDKYSANLLTLVQRKLESDQDVLHAPALPDEEEEGAQVIDLMEVLKQSLAARAADTEEARDKRSARDKSTQHKEVAASRRAHKQPAKEAVSRAAAADVDPDTSKTELYELAKELNIHGRSHMSKQDLLKAIRKSR